MLDATSSRRPWAPARARGTSAFTQPVRQRDEADYPATLRTVVTLARQRVEGCDLASGILIREGKADIAEATEPLAADLDRLQHVLGDGPGPEACGISSTVRSADLSSDARWPSFSPHARRRGIAAIASIPLVPGREFPWWFGWLTFYTRQPGPFPSASIALAETLGLYFSATVNSSLHAKSLEAALASRDLIGQAKGIIMARKNVDDDRAFAILRQASQHTNRQLRDVAEEVVRSCGREGVGQPAAR